MKFLYITLLCFSIAYANTNSIIRLEKNKPAPYTGTLMPELTAEYLANTEQQYTELVPKFNALSTNYFALKKENKELNLFYTNKIIDLGITLKETSRDLRIFKFGFTAGGPALFIGGVAVGCFLTYKLVDALKSL